MYVKVSCQLSVFWWFWQKYFKIFLYGHMIKSHYDAVKCILYEIHNKQWPNILTSPRAFIIRQLLLTTFLYVNKKNKKKFFKES